MDKFESRFESYDLACKLEGLDRYRNTTPELQSKLSIHYTALLFEYGLEIFSVSSKGIEVFPVGSKVRSSHHKEGWVVPNKHIYNIGWGLVRIFLDNGKNPLENSL